MDIHILYEDNHIVAVDKPAGLVAHRDGKQVEPSLSDWVLEKYPESQSVGEPIHTSDNRVIERPGIVHRLDRETSGVMLIAKTKEGFDCLKKQFQEHRIQKEYNAFIYGMMKKDADTIDRPIGRSSKDFRMWSAQRGARGEMREAVTEYKVLNKDDRYSFVQIFPKTGRTHQIRVHFKAVHYPLVADPLYAPTQKNELGFTRLALHSHRITFRDVSGSIQTVTAPYPYDFIRAMSLLQTSPSYVSLLSYE